MRLKLSSPTKPLENPSHLFLLLVSVKRLGMNKQRCVNPIYCIYCGISLRYVLACGLQGIFLKHWSWFD